MYIIAFDDKKHNSAHTHDRVNVYTYRPGGIGGNRDIRASLSPYVFLGPPGILIYGIDNRFASNLGRKKAPAFKQRVLLANFPFNMENIGTMKIRVILECFSDPQK